MATVSDYFRYLRNRTEELLPEDKYETHEIIVRVGNIPIPTEYTLRGVRCANDVAITLHGELENGNEVQTHIYPASLLLHMEVRKRTSQGTPRKIGFHADSQNDPN